MIKACVFDMDGTLADTIQTIAYYANTALAEYGLPVIEAERYKYLVGNGYIVLIKNMFKEIGCDDDALFAQVAERYDGMYKADFMHLTKAYDGIPSMLERLNAEGIKIGVVSNKPHDILLMIIEKLFGGIRFDCIAGGRPDIPLKPDPFMLNAMLDKMEAKPCECAYFGDTRVDMQTGVAAGVNTVGVLWGFRKRDELTENGAEHIIAHPSEILGLIERI